MALVGDISLHSTVSGQCHSEYHMGSMCDVCVMWLCRAWLFPRFISINKNDCFVRNELDNVIIFDCNIIISTKILIKQIYFLSCTVLLLMLHAQVPLQWRFMACTLGLR